MIGTVLTHFRGVKLSDQEIAEIIFDREKKQILDITLFSSSESESGPLTEININSFPLI